jgi:hypothetical protein
MMIGKLRGQRAKGGAEGREMAAGLVTFFNGEKGFGFNNSRRWRAGHFRARQRLRRGSQRPDGRPARSVG